jgi:hypothetical protein
MRAERISIALTNQTSGLLRRTKQSSSTEFRFFEGGCLSWRRFSAPAAFWSRDFAYFGPAAMAGKTVRDHWTPVNKPSPLRLVDRLSGLCFRFPRSAPPLVAFLFGNQVFRLWSFWFAPNDGERSKNLHSIAKRPIFALPRQP